MVDIGASTVQSPTAAEQATRSVCSRAVFAWLEVWRLACPAVSTSREKDEGDAIADLIAVDSGA
ncbi:hypothetical protein GCM10023197_45570 [Gordonia humi]